MSYDLSINMSTLETLASDLGSIVNELENADDNADAVAEATGHDDLRGRVEDFAGKWQIKREQMIEDVKQLSEILNAIVETFTEVDAELARSLEESAKKGEPTGVTPV